MKKFILLFGFTGLRHLILPLIICSFTSTQAQPVYDSNSRTVAQGQSQSKSILNFSVPAGNDRLLVVCGGGFGTVSSITFDGDAMTQEVTATQSNVTNYIFTYKLGSDVTETIGDIVVTGNNVVHAAARSYHNVDQTTPVDNPTSVTSTSTASSLSVSSEPNDLVCDCVNGTQTNGPYTFTADGGQLQTFHDGTGVFAGAYEMTIAGSHEAGSASVPMDWSMSGTVIAIHVAVNLNSVTLLPVELTNFEAKNAEKGVYLGWRTLSELNNKGFEIQRSLDGKTWQTLDFITGHGTTDEIQDYQYYDTRPFEGMNYYRLKQLTFEGKFEYSDIEAIRYENSQNQMVLIYPNPVKDGALTIKLDKYDNDEIQIQVYDLTGKTRLQQTSFSTYTELDIKDLSAGIYFMVITANGQTARQKIVVE